MIQNPTFIQRLSGPVVVTKISYQMTLINGIILASGVDGIVNITLPPAREVFGQFFQVKCTNDDNAVNLVPNGAELVDDSNDPIEMCLHESISVFSVGNKWWIL